MAQAEDGLELLHQFYQTHQHLQVEFGDLRGRIQFAAGAFSEVSKAILTVNGQDIEVACKELRFVDQKGLTPSEVVYRRLALELHVWVTRLRDPGHNHVLPILRFAINERNHYPILITKYMPNGHLIKFVSERENEPIDFLGIIKGIASGIKYLHDNGITHGDVKCANILMSADENPQPLLTDFGIAHVLNPGLVTMQLATSGEELRGTLRYMSREMFSDATENFYTTQADVWAFGMTIYELVTNKAPYQDKRELLVPMSILRGELPVWPENDDNLHMSLRGQGLMDRLRNVCNHCWNDANERPDMNRILALLEAIP